MVYCNHSGEPPLVIASQFAFSEKVGILKQEV